MTKQQRQKRYDTVYNSDWDYMHTLLEKMGEAIHRSAFRAAAKAAADHVGVEVQASATAQAILRAGRK